MTEPKPILPHKLTDLLDRNPAQCYCDCIPELLSILDYYQRLARARARQAEALQKMNVALATDLDVAEKKLADAETVIDALKKELAERERT
ncbi:MAG: hypothetical protein WC683_05975 [bacterium]